MISNILREIMNMNGIKIYYHIFFKDFFKKFILVNKVEDIMFLNLRYREEDLNS